MKRIPEPELMDTPEQALAYAEADFSEANALFMTYFEALHPEPLGAARILDLGCGPADITLRFARCYPQCRVQGVDGAEAMLSHGRSALNHDPTLKSRVELVCERLPSHRLPQQHFDVIISNSLLHHLQEPRVLWDTLRHCAKPGAVALIMDLRRPSTEPAVDTLVESYALDAPEVLRQDFRNSLLAAFTPEEVEAQLLQSNLLQMQVEMVSDRHFSVAGVVC